MGIPNFKKGDRCIYFNFPYHFDTFKIEDIRINESNKRIVILTDNTIGPFFLTKDNYTPIDDIGLYLEEARVYIIKYDTIGKLYLKRKLCEIGATNKFCFQKLGIGGLAARIVEWDYRDILKKLKNI